MAKSWGDVFNAAKHRGHDPSYAAYLADEWEKRKMKPAKPKPITTEKQEQKVIGPVGWICPKCGRGNSPSTSTCCCTPPPPMVITC